MDPCIEELRAGDGESAWAAFLGRYQRVVFATIRHYATERDDVSEVIRTEVFGNNSRCDITGSYTTGTGEHGFLLSR